MRRHQDAVYATAMRLLGNAADAEDVAQTVFLRAFERFDVIGGSPEAAGWLKVVTRNACLNHLSRYRARWQLFSELEQPDGAAFEPAVETEQAPEAYRAIRHEELEEALRGLPDHQRVPLVLFHFEDASYQDIAQMLGVTVGKVKTDIHRGRLALRKLLT